MLNGAVYQQAVMCNQKKMLNEAEERDYLIL